MSECDCVVVCCLFPVQRLSLENEWMDTNYFNIFLVLTNTVISNFLCH